MRSVIADTSFNGKLKEIIIMFKTKKWVNVLILVFTAICILICICASVVDAISPSASDWGKMNSAVGVIALCFAGYYMAKGYSKSEAKFFKIFAYLYALNELCTVIGSAIGTDDRFPLIISIGGLILSLVFAFGKNLGKVISLILVAAIFIIQAVSVEYAVVKAAENVMFGSLSVVNLAIMVVLSAMLFVMTYAKYVDKAERHSKDN